MIIYTDLQSFLEDHNVQPDGEDLFHSSGALDEKGYQDLLEVGEKLFGQHFKSFLESIFVKCEVKTMPSETPIRIEFVLKDNTWREVQDSFYNYYWEPKKAYLLLD